MNESEYMGPVFNGLTETFFEGYDSGRFGLLQAKELIHLSVYAVHLCEEDETEAIRTSLRCRCGSCLKKMKKGERLYSPYFTDMDWKYITNNIEWKVAYHSYCEDCLTEIFGADAADIMEACRDDENSIVRSVWRGDEK